MKVFTCVTNVRDSFHVTQHSAERSDDALRLHIGGLPYDAGSGPFDEELDWLLEVAEGQQQITMLPLGGCKNTWMRLEGARFEPKYITYVVQSDTRNA